MNCSSVANPNIYMLGNQNDISLRSEKISWFYVFMLGIYILTAVSISFMPEYNLLSKVIGYVASVLCVLKLLTKGFLLTKESVLFVCWLIWSLTGALACASQIVFWDKFTTLLSLFILYFLIIRIGDNYRNITALAVSCFLGVGLVIVIAFVSGDFQYGMEAGERISGTAGNANSLAILMHHMIFLQLIFFELSKKKWIKLLMMLILPFQAKIILASGSRKGLILFVLILLSWCIYIHFKDFTKRPLFFILMVLGVVGGVIWLLPNLENSIVWNRLIQTTEGGTEGDQARLIMLKEGIRVFSQNPIFGVGLDNFRFHSVFRTYSHNNYIEILTGTGVVGFIIFYSAYLSFAWKSYILSKKQTKYSVVSKIISIMLCYSALIFFVSPLYYSKITWIMLGLISAFYEVSRRRGVS